MTVSVTMGGAAMSARPAVNPRGSTTEALDVFDRHGRVLLAVARQILGDAVEAEEAVIEALQALASGTAEEVGSGPDLARLCAWQRRVALRRLQRRLLRGGPVPAPDGPVGGDPAAAALRHQVVTAALANLPDEQQQILRFAYEQGLDAEMIGAVLRKPVTAVHVAIGEALDRLALVISHLWRHP